MVFRRVETRSLYEGEAVPLKIFVYPPSVDTKIMNTFLGKTSCLSTSDSFTNTLSKHTRVVLP